MNFKPTIDITKYTDAVGRFTAAGSRLMLEDTEKEYQVFGTHIEDDKSIYSAVSEQINRLLSEEGISGFDAIGEIINSSDYLRLSGIYDDLKAFRSSFAIYVSENRSGIENTIYHIVNSVEEYVSLKTEAMYMFRRAQLYVDSTEYESIFLYLIDRDLSFFFFINMLNELAIGDKYRVGCAMSDLYLKNGMPVESEIIGEFARDNYVPCGECISQFSTDMRAHVTPYKRVCFVSCVNDERAYEECLYYISKLKTPDGYNVDAVSISDAHGMSEGYNEAMDSADADIYVYLHQDVCILNPFFLCELTRIFDSDSQIGMVGMVGSPTLPPDGVMWHGPRTGNLYAFSPDSVSYICPDIGQIVQIHDVEAVDGLLIATNKRIRWRDDLFDGWDFYDISLCAEYQKAGYRIVVPEQATPWVAHDDGIMNLERYNEFRHRFLCEYR